MPAWAAVGSQMRMPVVMAVMAAISHFTDATVHDHLPFSHVISPVRQRSLRFGKAGYLLVLSRCR